MTGQALRSTIRFKILLCFLVITLVPLIVMAAQGYHCAKQALEDTAGRGVDWWLGELLRRAVLVGLVTFVAIVGVALWLSASVTRPIRRLAESADRIAAGDRTREVEIPSRDEVGALAVSFNRMLAQVVANERLAAVGTLSASVAHEMRNPLSTIKLNLQMLARKLDREPELAKRGRAAAREVDRLDRMLSDLLDYSRPLELDRKAALASELLAGSLEAVAEPVARKRIEIVRGGDAADASIEVDADRVVQALANLVLNAVQASPEGRRVVVNACAGEIEGREAITFEVTDSGEGLSPEGARRAFEPFYTTRPGGTGLGLANVAKIARAHGGEATLGSAPGGGAIARLVMPKEQGS
jgi:signal transduction histidine kinase